MASLFIAEALGDPLSIGEQISLLVFMIIASKGAAGVTGAGLATLAGGLSSHRPELVDGVGVIVGIDRFMSEARALTNFAGNSVATVLVGHWTGGIDRERFDLVLAGERPFDETDFIDDEFEAVASSRSRRSRAISARSARSAQLDGLRAARSDGAVAASSASPARRTAKGCVESRVISSRHRRGRGGPPGSRSPRPQPRDVRRRCLVELGEPRRRACRSGRRRPAAAGGRTRRAPRPRSRSRSSPASSSRRRPAGCWGRRRRG